MKRIGIEISKDGSLTLATDGFTGKACLKDAQDVLNEMEKVAGIDTTTIEIKMKEEYYREEQGHHQSQQ
jgi:hypothetical protein